MSYFYSIQLWNRLRAFSGFSHVQVTSMLKIVFLHSEAAWWEQRRGSPFRSPLSYIPLCSPAVTLRNVRAGSAGGASLSWWWKASKCSE